MPTPITDDLHLADVLAKARVRLDLPALPAAAPGGLIAWAIAPDLDANPLPSLDERRESRGASLGWPIGRLPAAPLVADLAARGLTFRRGLGYAVHGDPIEPQQAARLLADVLDDAASALPERPLAHVGEALALLAEEEYEIRCRVADKHADRTAFDAALAREDWTRPLREALDAFGDSRRPLPSWDADREAARTLNSMRHALTHTARDLHVSRGARTAALDLVRPHLPDGRPEVDEDAVAAFLAAYDRAEAVRRSDLGRAYVDAGAPGGLDMLPLYALASERWGAPVKRRGHITFRPAPCNDRRPALRLT